jgi:phosphoribosylformimino-5-aminoimidazole carboxamide ribotide isomerase
MLIVPAIDLKDGQCVRLYKGRFDAVTEYGEPRAQMTKFAEAGADWVHVVDLDGAKAGAPRQHDLIANLVQVSRAKIQCGGGVRTRADVEALLEAGVRRVVVGSAAVRDPKNVRAWLADFGRERICLALDVRRVGALSEVVVNGWTEGSGVTLEGVLDLYAHHDVRHVLVTDVSRDGALTGPSLGVIRELARLYPEIAFQASGGVAKLTDLIALRGAGADAAIVGKALYERRFTLEDALAL